MDRPVRSVLGNPQGFTIPGLSTNRKLAKQHFWSRLTSPRKAAHSSHTERHNPEIFEHYFRGLALLTKSDFFYPFGSGSIQEFYLAFQMFFKERGLWDGKARFEDAVILNSNVSDDPMFRRLAALAQNVIDNPTAPAVVTGNDAALMKMYFDSVLIKCARDFLKDRFGKHVEHDTTSGLGG